MDVDYTRSLQQNNTKPTRRYSMSVNDYENWWKVRIIY